MKKKDKRKKSDQEPLNQSDSISMKKDQDKNDGSASTSRSRSRQRRSLSSLFRRSASRAPSEEKKNESDNIVDDDVFSEARTNPRGHLKRMTVREALVYDRKRGRSPNRRALRLEKKILNKEADITDDMSASLPYLTDIAPTEDQTAAPVASSSVEARSGSTLPRAKRKKRSRQDDDSAQNSSHTNSGSNISNEQSLPLDKRKYIINQENGNSNGKNDSILNSDHQMNPTLVHSKMSLDLHKNDRTLGTESYNQFLALRENRSPLSLSPVDVPDSTPLISRSKSPIERVKTPNKNVGNPSVFDHSVFNFMTNKRPSIHNDNHKQRESIIPAPENAKEDAEKVKRTSYISPRRFSRGTRPSVTSNKSDASDNSVFSNSSDPKVTSPNVVGNVKVKYQRHFSRDRKKTAEKQVNVNESEIEPLKTFVDINKANITEPQKIDASTSMGDVSLLGRHQSTSSNQEQKERQINSLESNIGESVIETDNLTVDENSTNPHQESDFTQAEEHPLEQVNNESLSPFLREVIVIDSNAELPDISGNDHECVFRPIKTEQNDSGDHLTKIESTEDIVDDDKLENNCDDIQVIASDIQADDTKEGHHKDNNKESKHKKNSRFSMKRKKTKVKKNEKEAPKETAEKEHTDNKKSWSGKSKKEKKKNKKHNHASKKDNQDEKESHAVNEVCEKELNQEVEQEEKKTKSILKKRAKHDTKKTHTHKHMKRTSSLNNLLNPRENQIREERRQSISMGGKRSMSLDNINVDKEVLQKSVKLKNENLKVKVETTNEKTTKPAKPAPKLSLVAIIAMRSKISRMKKARQEREANKKTTEDIDANSERPEESTNLENEAEQSDLSVAKIFYENEINASIGKSDNSIEIIEATDKEVKDIVFEKQVQFAPYCDDTMSMSEEEMIKKRQRNTRLTSRRESKVRQRQKKVISCCKKFVAFLFSHIGLCSVVVAYCILGGIIFKALEGEREIEKKKEIREITQNYTEMIHRLAFENSQTKGNRENFKNEVNRILKNFSVVIHKQTKEAGWDGKEIRVNPDRKEGEPEAEPEQWSYPSSLLYAITVMTTIGE